MKQLLQFLSDLDTAVVYFVAVSVAKLSLIVWKGSQRPKNAEYIGRVTSLKIYPVKSMGGVALDEAECSYAGIRLPGTAIHDRCWMVTFGDDNRFVTARQEPKLILIQLSFREDQIIFDAPLMTTLQLPLFPAQDDLKNTKVWGDQIDGWDCGDEAAEWISRYLGNKSGHRIIYHNPSDSQMQTRTAAIVASHKKRLVVWDSVKPEDQMSFNDDGPYLLTVEASLGDLNSRMKPSDNVPMETFRPTIVVTANRPAFDEDEWSEVFIGDEVKFSTMMYCTRCLLTTINPSKGEKRDNNEPINTLKTYRKILPATESPCFGNYLVCDRPGSIRVNEPVYVIKRRQHSSFDY